MVIVCGAHATRIVDVNQYSHKRKASQTAHSNKDEHILKKNFELALQRFKKSSQCSEVSLEQLLLLLETELQLVEHLQAGETGMAIEDAIDARERLLSRTIPSLVYMYNSLMDFATYSPLLTPDNTYLNYHERHAYFKRIVDTLESCYHDFETIQYRASLAYTLQPDDTNRS
jgi:hypothetical protein